MSQEENNDLNLGSFQKNQYDSLEREAERRKQWLKEVESNTAMQAFFKDYEEAEVKSFIDSYLTYKNMWIEHGEMYSKMKEEDSIQWVSQANEYLGYILQKKLFDLQCLWRAEKIELPEVEVCYDFVAWGYNIFNCPFLEPITPDDVAIMQQFLQQGNADVQFSWFDGWQDHKEIIDAYNSDEEERDFPDWYDFYNGRRGTGVHMLLPDIKGEKESFYQKLWWESVRKEREGDNPVATQQPFVPLKHLSWHNKETAKWFVNTFETKEIRHLYEAMEWSMDNNEDKEELEAELDLLFAAKEYVAIESHYDWKEAIKIAAQKYRQTKISEALPEAYEQYLMNIQMGIGFPNESPLFGSINELKKQIRIRIIEGRKLNGEPENLDF